MRFVFFQSNWFVSAAELKEISIDKIIDFNTKNYFCFESFLNFSTKFLPCIMLWQENLNIFEIILQDYLFFPQTKQFVDNNLIDN